MTASSAQKPDRDQDDDSDFPLTLGGTMVSFGFCILAFVQTKQDHSFWAHGIWIVIMLVSFLAACVFLVLTLLDSSWYDKPLPRTDSDEPPDELRPKLPDSDHRSW